MPRCASRGLVDPHQQGQLELDNSAAEIAYSHNDVATLTTLAVQGNAIAQVALGKMHYHGQGVVQDYVQGHQWFNLSGATASDAEIRDNASKNRDSIAAKMTPAQIAEAQRLAREWKAK